MPTTIPVAPTIQEIIEGKIRSYLSSQKAVLDRIVQSQTALQDQVNELKTGLESQVTSLDGQITNMDNTLQSLRPFFLGFAIAVGVILLAILVLLILVKAAQAKDVASRKEKLKAVEETSPKNTTDLESTMRELQNQINRQYSEFTERLDRHEREISIIKNRVPQNAGNAAPPAHPQTPQQFLTDANAVVANHNAGFYGPELQAHFQIKYFNRTDPNGMRMTGRVQETDDIRAFFCGIVNKDDLLLIPNHKNQNVTYSYVDEFFAYPPGHNQNTIHRIDNCAVLTFEHNSGCWRIETKGSIN